MPNRYLKFKISTFSSLLTEIINRPEPLSAPKLELFTKAHTNFHQLLTQALVAAKLVAVEDLENYKKFNPSPAHLRNIRAGLKMIRDDPIFLLQNQSDEQGVMALTKKDLDEIITEVDQQFKGLIAEFKDQPDDEPIMALDFLYQIEAYSTDLAEIYGRLKADLAKAEIFNHRLKAIRKEVLEGRPYNLAAYLETQIQFIDIQNIFRELKLMTGIFNHLTQINSRALEYIHEHSCFLRSYVEKMLKADLSVNAARGFHDLMVTINCALSYYDRQADKVAYTQFIELSIEVGLKYIQLQASMGEIDEALTSLKSLTQDYYSNLDPDQQSTALTTKLGALADQLQDQQQRLQTEISTEKNQECFETNTKSSHVNFFDRKRHHSSDEGSDELSKKPKKYNP